MPNRRTLKIRLDSNIITKRTLRKHPSRENEIRLVTHIKRLKQFGFAPTLVWLYMCVVLLTTSPNQLVKKSFLERRDLEKKILVSIGLYLQA